MLDDIGEPSGRAEGSKAARIRKIIETQEKQLQKYQEQKAEMGIHTPPYVLTQIEKLEGEIKELQSELG